MERGWLQLFSQKNGTFDRRVWRGVSFWAFFLGTSPGSLGQILNLKELYGRECQVKAATRPRI